MDLRAFYDDDKPTVDLDAFYGDDDPHGMKAYLERKRIVLEKTREALEASLTRPRKANPYKRDKPITRESFWGINKEEEKPKRKKPTDLNGPTRAWCEKRGWKHQRVDRYDPALQRHFDLYGFIDFLCSDGSGTIALQVTSRDNMAARKKKILESPHLGTVRSMGWKILLLGFYKDDKGHWAAKETYI